MLGTSIECLLGVTEYLLVATEYLLVATEYLLVATEHLLVATEYLPVATEYLLGVTDYLLGALCSQMYGAANCLPPLAPIPTDPKQAFGIFAKGSKAQLCEGAVLKATMAGFQDAFSPAPFGTGKRFADARNLSSFLGSTSAEGK